MLPPPEILAREEALAAALSVAARYSLDGGRLSLFDADDTHLATFVRGSTRGEGQPLSPPTGAL